MRRQYQAILKENFYNSLVSTREALGLTQKKMAQILAMDDRSYSDLDHGISCCSALTFARFLIYCCDDPIMFLVSLQVSFETIEEAKISKPTILNIKEALSYRVPFPVTEFRIRCQNVYSICPRCRTPLDREYTSYCDRCGQQLDWSKYR